MATKDKIVADDWQEHRRRSVRLKGFDYARAGAYYVTVCVQGRRNLFGEVVDGTMRLNEFGHIAAEEWLRTGELRPRIRLDAFVVMPNHIHGILAIDGEGTQQRAPTTERFGIPTSDSIPTIVRLFKSATTTRINRARNLPGTAVWQRNYYEHVIRNDRDWNRVRAYIRENPEQWDQDEENPLRKE